MTDIVKPTRNVEALPPVDDGPKVGEWYWVTDTKDDDEGKPVTSRWLGCVIDLGTNYAEVMGVSERKYYVTGHERIHFDAFPSRCERETDPDGYITRKTDALKDRVNELLGDVQELTARLGVGERKALGSGASESTSALTVTDGRSPERFKAELVKAKEKDLPALFEQIEKTHETLAGWMKARLIPLKASIGGQKKIEKRIEGQIFNVELYAGLCETVERIAKGKPAADDEPIHLMQRRHYMDEECLARYEAGGMTFASWDAFHAWLVKPDNRDRIFPFPRCVVAFKVRRNSRETSADDFGGNLFQYISFMLSGERELDKQTFLYLRNGGNLHCLRTGIEFGDQLFPDFEHTNLKGKLWWKDGGFITDHDYQERKIAYAQRVAVYNARVDLDPPSKRRWPRFHNEKYVAPDPRYDHPDAIEHAKACALNNNAIHAKEDDPKDRFVDPPFIEISEPEDSTAGYVPFDPSAVEFDDATKHIHTQMEHHNRLVLILQGLLDRSPVFHPHPPWKIGTPAGFERALRLHYDDARTLTPGEAPDFEAYRRQCDLSIRPGSITVGQQRAWMAAMAERENERTGDRGRRRYFKPSGDAGPGTLARVVKVTKATCTFTWSITKDRWDDGERVEWTVQKSFTCPRSLLFNVSAYTPRNYRIFYNDPRTRADYLRWAPWLLEAEEWHAGNRTLVEPVIKPKPPPTWDAQMKYRHQSRLREIRDRFPYGTVVEMVEDVRTTDGTLFAKGDRMKVDSVEAGQLRLTRVSDHKRIRKVPPSDVRIVRAAPAPKGKK